MAQVSRCMYAAVARLVAAYKRMCCRSFEGGEVPLATLLAGEAVCSLFLLELPLGVVRSFFAIVLAAQHDGGPGVPPQNGHLLAGLALWVA